ncbi:hypothetical protein NL676_029579 [Syzygium grande]|nr:hypothetical protein NL676_029579 [Syzygium grande]
MGGEGEKGSGTIVICIGKIYWKDHFANVVEGVQEEKLQAHLGYFGVTGNRALQPIAAFAKITFEKPYIVLLDEPSNLLDLDAAEALIQGLVLFQAGILMVSHDQHLIAGGLGGFSRQGGAFPWESTGL